MHTKFHIPQDLLLGFFSLYLFVTPFTVKYINQKKYICELQWLKPT